jgi:hypothetical protein
LIVATPHSHYFIVTLLFWSRGPHCHNHAKINSQINAIQMTQNLSF